MILETLTVRQQHLDQMLPGLHSTVADLWDELVYAFAEFMEYYPTRICVIEK